MRGRGAKERGFVVVGPDFINSVAAIYPPSPFARIDCDLAAILRPRKNARQDCPCIVSLPPRPQRKAIAPFHEDSPAAYVCKRRQREIRIFLLNLLLNNSLVVVLGARSELSEIFACLICLQKREQPPRWCFDFLSYGLVVAGDKLRRSWFAA